MKKKVLKKERNARKRLPIEDKRSHWFILLNTEKKEFYIERYVITERCTGIHIVQKKVNKRMA